MLIYQLINILILKSSLLTPVSKHIENQIEKRRFENLENGDNVVGVEPVDLITK